MINKRQVDTPTQIIEFIKRYWLFITALLVGIPYLRRYMAEQSEQTRQASQTLRLEGQKADSVIIKETKLLVNQNPLTQNKKRLAITKSKDLHAASSKLATDFGVRYSDNGNWYDFMNPKGYSENDNSIKETLVLYRNYFDKLEKLYYEVDTNSRSLRKDILQYLDAGELKYLRKYLKI
ncbi:hypothetical protein [Flavobacterium xinjiangense]|uniref:Uncharacterized protein n=1 Tax=Flavobacterium xinjiangense TaxID=178356 RepID=A0A1M7L1K0_9FLAO|nr:hypothetical protein [Flavobacterium xinjiangense]SHM71836.1 hypothetical protein SAMN05216269_106155 [Flavobacterium xinjiangense]